MQNELNMVISADELAKGFKQRHYNKGSDSTRHSKLVSNICSDIGGMSFWLRGAFERFTRNGKVLEQDAILFSEARITSFSEELQAIEHEILSGTPEYLENTLLIPDAKHLLNAGKSLLGIIKDQNIGQIMRNAVDEG